MRNGPGPPGACPLLMRGTLGGFGGPNICGVIMGFKLPPGWGNPGGFRILIPSKCNEYRISNIMFKNYATRTRFTWSHHALRARWERAETLLE